MKTLIVIDSYISDLNRQNICFNLIQKIRKVFPNYEILLVNKYGYDYDLQNEVDYYFNFNKGFKVGVPPNEFIDNKDYELPYVYVNFQLGTLENWMPLTGVTDHVAGIYNSFIISTQIAKLLGYKKIFKFEYDIDFNIDELKTIKSEIEHMKDYIIYGKRKEGKWAKEHQYLIDVQIIGYDIKVFNNFNIVKNDDEYWSLCKKINYFGKWIEYIIPSIIEYNRFENNLIGTDNEGYLSLLYPNTKFDTINGEGFWKNRWETIPLLCRLINDGGLTEKIDSIGIFYWNEDYEEGIDIECIITNEENKVIHRNTRKLNKKQWVFDEIQINEWIRVKTKKSVNSKMVEKDFILHKKDIKKLNCRVVLK